MNNQINIQVCYALPEHQEIIKLKLNEGAQVQQALEQSGLLSKYPDISLEQGKFGIFGKLVRLDSPLHEGDRVEVYRPLIADPKEVRRKRAEEGKAMKKGGGNL
jgi:uncharacterized protein